MERPYYAVQVDGPGWTLATTHGVLPDLTAAALIDPFDYTYAWREDKVPGHREPDVATWTVAARSAQTMPDIAEGQAVRVRVWAGPSALADPYIDADMEITEVTAQLLPGHRWPVRLTISSADTLSILRSRFPDVASVEPFMGVYGAWRGRLAALGYHLGYRIAVPDWPSIGVGDEDDWYHLISLLEYPDYNAGDYLEAVNNSYLPDGTLWTMIGHRGPDLPDGYTPARSNQWPGATNYPWPDSDQYYLLVPSDRRMTGVLGLPYLLTKTPDGHVTTAVDPDPSTVSALARIDAAWCEVPASGRQSRELSPTTALLEGFRREQDGPDTDATRTVSLPDPDYVRSRTIRTVATVQHWNDSFRPGGPAYRLLTRLGEQYLDPSATSGERWVFDDFKLHPHRIPQNAVHRVMGAIFPAPVRSATGIPRVLRWAVVHGIPAAASLRPRGEVRGFISKAKLTIAAGRPVVAVRLVPGIPNPTGPTTDQLTAAELAAHPTLSATRAVDVDPAVTAADMRLVKNG